MPRHAAQTLLLPLPAVRFACVVALLLCAAFGASGASVADVSDTPRNFACAATIKGVPDGQLFWIIKFGSPGTAMPPHAALKDEQIWQLILYLRQLAK